MGPRADAGPTPGGCMGGMRDGMPGGMHGGMHGGMGPNGMGGSGPHHGDR